MSINVAPIISPITNSENVARFAGRLRDWDTRATYDSSPVNLSLYSSQNGFPVTGSVVNFSTDATGNFSVDVNGAIPGTEYLCWLSDGAGNIHEIHKLTGVAV